MLKQSCQVAAVLALCLGGCSDSVSPPDVPEVELSIEYIEGYHEGERYGQVSGYARNIGKESVYYFPTHMGPVLVYALDESGNNVHLRNPTVGDYDWLEITELPPGSIHGTGARFPMAYDEDGKLYLLPSGRYRIIAIFKYRLSPTFGKDDGRFGPPDREYTIEEEMEIVW